MCKYTVYIIFMILFCHNFKKFDRKNQGSSYNLLQLLNVTTENIIAILYF